jgi:hypothetical protein
LFRLEIMKNPRIILILGATLFGGLAWLSVSMGEQYQITLTAPLVIVDVPRGWAIRTPVPRTIQLRYHGDGWRLSLLELGTDPRLEVPFSSLRQASFNPPGGDTTLAAISSSEGMGRIITHFDLVELAPSRSGVRLVDVKPDSIYLALDRYEEKKVPVTLDVTPMFREGYGQVGEPTVTPDSVIVGGAAFNVRALESWRTARTILEDLRTPVDADVPVASSTSTLLTVHPRTVRITLNVQPFAEKVLPGVTIEGTDIPGNNLRPSQDGDCGTGRYQAVGDACSVGFPHHRSVPVDSCGYHGRGGPSDHGSGRHSDCEQKAGAFAVHRAKEALTASVIVRTAAGAANDVWRG